MNLIFRQATIEDLPGIVRLLADDFLGATRERCEDPLPESYLTAFAEIDASETNELIVTVSEPPASAGGFLSEPVAAATGSNSETIVGTMQLTFIPGISFQGARRLLVEAVRVDVKHRSRGIGRKMMEWAIERARARGCLTVQLTTNAERKDAHRFYEKLGFKGSHLGMKLTLR
jgi:GNAT superfamily N-acetyltransferase